MYGAVTRSSVTARMGYLNQMSNILLPGQKSISYSSCWKNSAGSDSDSGSADFCSDFDRSADFDSDSCSDSDRYGSFP